jgi:hypothetical protein
MKGGAVRSSPVAPLSRRAGTLGLKLGYDPEALIQSVGHALPPMRRKDEFVKYAALLVLVAQNSALALTMRYSRTVKGEMYIAR